MIFCSAFLNVIFADTGIDEFFIHSNKRITDDLKKHVSYSDSIKTDSIVTDFNFIFRNFSRSKYSPFQEVTFRFGGGNKHVQFFIEPSIVSAHKGFDFLHTKYERNGFSGGFKNAFIKLVNQNQRITAIFGRSIFFWGQSINSSIIKGLDSGPLDYINISFKIDKIKYEILSAQLGTIMDSNKNNYNRFLIGKRFSTNNSKLQIKFGELFIYSGINRGAELIYLNPLIPSFLIDINTSNFVSGDNYNSIIFTDFKYNYNDQISLIGEFILDDFQIDDTGRENKLGSKLGVYYENNSKFEIFYEYTNINSFTYLHGGDFTSFHNYSRPIGYKYGPHARANDFLIRYNLKENLSFDFLVTLLEKGEKTVMDNNFSDEQSFQMSNSKFYRLFDLGLTKFWKNMCFQINYSNFPYVNQEISGLLESQTKKSFVLDFAYFFR